jgi:hypothetical protein
MKYHHSKSLGKMAFDEYMHLLPKNHRYRTTEKHLFNGKEETGLKPQRMTPHLWRLEYNRNHKVLNFIMYHRSCNVLNVYFNH